jgi:uncharacterized membrane protein
MRSLLKLATYAGVLMLFAATGAQAQYGGNRDYSQITVCNRTGHTVYLAMQTPVSPYSPQGRVKGWWMIYPQECLPIGTFPAGQVDFFANSADWSRIWDGLHSPQSVQTCLRFPGAFDRVNHPGYTCARDEQVKSMASRQVPPGPYTLDLT